MKFKGGIVAGTAMVIALALAGCQSSDYYTAVEPPIDSYAYGVLKPLDTKYYASDEPMKLGFQHFYAGDFGLSQKYFQAAVEKTPRDAVAWVGLAASYDRLRRFDLADHAYAKAIALNGVSVQILNNQGYSHLLRGDLNGARAKFLAAYELDPTNPIIQNNLVLLSSSSRMVRRHEPAYN